MHGGDSLFGRMASTTHVYRDSGIVDSELDHKTHKVTEKLSDSINTIANEPSVAFYRIQEHVRKTLPQLVELKHEVEEVQQQVQGACFDTEYAGNAVKGMEKSVVHFQNIQELLKNSMFMKQQIDYDEVRRRQGRPLSGPNNGGGGARQEGPAGNKAEEEEGGSNPMEDSAVSTDSSLGASAHAASEEDSFEELEETNNEADSAEKDVEQEQEAAFVEKNKDLAEQSSAQTCTSSTTESEDRVAQRSQGEKEDRAGDREAENKETEQEGDREEEKQTEREKEATQNVLEESGSSTDTIGS